MLYEWRTYAVAPGQVSAALKRFQIFEMDLFKKHGIEVMGFWQLTPIEEPAQLACLLRFPNDKARSAAWKAFNEDPHWRQIKAQSEAGGPIFENISETVLAPVPFSPMQ